jgi:nucleoside-diphosphate kinase
MHKRLIPFNAQERITIQAMLKRLVCGPKYFKSNVMETTLVIIKPSGVERGLAGQVITRFEQKGLIIAGMKMIQLDDAILREHYAHLVDRPFFPLLLNSMKSSPVIVIAIKGLDAVAVVRAMTGVTKARNAAPGTIRGDFGMSGQENIVHASDSPENAAIEIARFFKPEELFDYQPCTYKAIYSPDDFQH